MTMASLRIRAVAIACCALAVALALAGVPGQARSQTEGTPPAPDAGEGPLAGDGMWIWYVSKAGGTAARIAKKAKRRGIEVVLIKSGDAGSTWSQFSSSL